jgi:hypothetical protein
MNADQPFEELWSRALQEEEMRMRRSWFEQHFVPLKENTKLFELKMQQCRARAEDVCKELVSWTEPIEHGRGAGREIWLQTPSGRVGGRADAIIQQNGRAIIVDFKSGHLTDEDEHKLGVKKSYVQQLKLYAALYHAQLGVWPYALRLVSTSGEPVDVPFTEEECLKMLQDAIVTLSTINCIMRDMPASYNVSVKRLATPSPTHCSGCSYRPCCAPYWDKRKTQEGTWPNDICGLLLTREKYAADKLFIEVDAGAGSSLTGIRGLNLSRHQGLDEATGEIIVLNLMRDSADGNFKQGPYTTIYALPRSRTSSYKH